MSLRKKLRDIESMGQLQTYLQRSEGEVSGQFWTLEVGDDDGGEWEVGIYGTYRVDTTGHDQAVIFEPASDLPFFQAVEISEEQLYGGAVKVLSRKSL